MYANILFSFVKLYYLISFFLCDRATDPRKVLLQFFFGVTVLRIPAHATRTRLRTRSMWGGYTEEGGGRERRRAGGERGRGEGESTKESEV